MFWVGILLIISAGSFLYVATIHILPEVLGSQGHAGHGHSHYHSQKENITKNKMEVNKVTQLVVMLTGLCLPYLLHFVHEV